MGSAPYVVTGMGVTVPDEALERVWDIYQEMFGHEADDEYEALERIVSRWPRLVTEIGGYQGEVVTCAILIASTVSEYFGVGVHETETSTELVSVDALRELLEVRDLLGIEEDRTWLTVVSYG